MHVPPPTLKVNGQWRGSRSRALPASCLGRLQGLRTLNGPVKKTPARPIAVIAPKRNLEPTLVNGTGPLVSGGLPVGAPAMHGIRPDTNTSQSILTTARRSSALVPTFRIHDFTALSSQIPRTRVLRARPPATSVTAYYSRWPRPFEPSPSDLTNVINNQR